MNFEEARAHVIAGGDPAAMARQVVASMTDGEKLRCLSGDGPFWAGVGDLADGGYHRSTFPAVRVPRLGLGGFAFSDGPRGVVVGRATCFPVSMARGASWDVELEERVGDAIGRELRATGATLFGGVCVNVLRHPAWGRAQETYGEDPHHVGEMGAALTRGVQRHAMACVKHFACNSMENSRFRVDVVTDEIALHEVYLPQFRRIVDEGVAAVMTAYNRVDGEWCGEHEALLTGVLRDEWGFDGFVISDWIFGLRDPVKSVRAGLDVEMPYRMLRAGALPEAIEAGEVSWGEVGRCVERVVATLLRFDDVLGQPAPPREVIGCAEHRALAREAARRSVVLLRNEPVGGTPVLPLDPARLERVAVFGRLAAEVNLGDAGSSDVWAPEAVTVLEGLRAALASAEVTFGDGSDPGAVGASAQRAGACVVVVGYTYADEGEYIGESGTAHLVDLFPPPDDPDEAEAFLAEVGQASPVESPEWVRARPGGHGFATGGDRASLRLHGADVALARAVAAVNPRTVVVVVAGSAVVSSEWDREVPAILWSGYAGMEAGHALADVMLGRFDPSGRLPFSVPADESHLPAFEIEAEEMRYDRWHGWWHLERSGTPAAYPFGFGLGYTTFALRSAMAEVRDGVIEVVAELENIGARDGSDVVQVYAHRDGADGPPRLIGFARCRLAPGAIERVEVGVPLDRLAERDPETHTMRVLAGSYQIRVARHAEDAGIERKLEVRP